LSRLYSRPNTFHIFLFPLLSIQNEKSFSRIREKDANKYEQKIQNNMKNKKKILKLQFPVITQIISLYNINDFKYITKIKFAYI